MEAKKISFGFSKNVKKSNILPPKLQTSKEESKVELIKCLEGKEIKLVEERPEESPLVIPMKEKGQKTSSALLSLMKRRAVLLGEDKEEEADAQVTDSKQNKNDSDNDAKMTLEQRAANELLSAVSDKGGDEEVNKLILPVVKPDDLPLDGAKESTLDDYDSIPIQQFGVAMLRGMGWVDPPKKKGSSVIDDAPLVRPKGMGLGADKALKKKPLLVMPEANEVLEIKRNAYVRILGGKYKDLYGQIEGFDDYAGRVIVKMAIGGTKEAFNEFLCQPVARKEYADYGKYINSAKYEEYKQNENKHSQTIVKIEKPYIGDDKNICIKEIKKEVGNDDFLKVNTTNLKSEPVESKPSKEELSQILQYEKHGHRKTKEIIKDEYDIIEKSKIKKNPKHEDDSKPTREDLRVHERHDASSHSRNEHSSTRTHKKHITTSESRARRSRSRHKWRDTSTSSSTSDTSYERKQRKNTKSKHRSKSKHRRHRSSTSDSTTSSSSSRSAFKKKRRHGHKKKSHKKNKKR